MLANLSSTFHSTINTVLVSTRKQQITTLLKGIETGDPVSVSVVNEAKYIQHNPQTHEGSEGLAKLFKRLSMMSPKVNIVRIFEDGDFIFGHTEYDFDTRNIGFEIFRFEEGLAVEHWDNIQKRQGPNSSGQSMVDGETAVADHSKTEENRSLIKKFVKQVLIEQQIEKLKQYVNTDQFIEHNPQCNQDIEATLHTLFTQKDKQAVTNNYQQCHRILAEGNFVLSVCEGYKNTNHTSFFDLFRLDKDMIVEHWDTTETIASRAEWKNDNGKF